MGGSLYSLNRSKLFQKMHFNDFERILLQLGQLSQKEDIKERVFDGARYTLNQFLNSIIVQIIQIIMMEQEITRQCKEVLKKNNLHPMKRLGKGGFSIVFLVEKIQLKQTQNQLYSVKCINKKQFLKRPSLQKYIQQQIYMWRELSHPNIVKLIRSFEDQGWIFMIMEYCDQGSLQMVQNTRQGKVFSISQTMKIAKEIVCGLQYMHSKNLIHRDIKAENVLISNQKNKKGTSYVTKICDLGFCREDDESVNTFCGTTNYMAPEIFEKKTYDLKVDIWALGVLIFSMLFGEFPFKGMNLFYEITTKCEKGFNLKAMKTRKNVSISKNDQEMLHQLFNEIFRIDPSKRIGISDLQKYKWFVTEKSSRNTTTQSDNSEDQLYFEQEKVDFIKNILLQVKSASFLTTLEEISFRYYISKFLIGCFQEKFNQNKKAKKAYEELLYQNQECYKILASSLKKNPIPNFAVTFNHKAKNFADFKEGYRVVVGYVFSKAHKNICEDLILRSRLKLKLFCCHVINRVFQKQNRSEIFGFYFTWLKKEKKTAKFDFKSFQKWIQEQNPDKLVQTVEIMNNKFYKRST